MRSLDLVQCKERVYVRKPFLELLLQSMHLICHMPYSIFSVMESCNDITILRLHFFPTSYTSTNELITIMGTNIR